MRGALERFALAFPWEIEKATFIFSSLWLEGSNMELVVIKKSALLKSCNDKHITSRPVRSSLMGRNLTTLIIPMAEFTSIGKTAITGWLKSFVEGKIFFLFPDISKKKYFFSYSFLSSMKMMLWNEYCIQLHTYIIYTYVCIERVTKWNDEWFWNLYISIFYCKKF